MKIFIACMLLIDGGMILGSLGFNYFKTHVLRDKENMDNNHKLFIWAAILLLVIFIVAMSDIF